MWGSQNPAKPWSTPAVRDTIKQRNTLRRTVQSNRAEYLAACGEVSRAKWEEFLADLEGNPDPARAWNLIKSLSGSLQSTAFCKPLIHNGRTLLTNTGKANAFVQQYVAVNRLSFDKTERTEARHLKKALQLPTAAESCCSPFTIRELDIAMRSKGAAGSDDIPPTFLKALGPMAKTELLSKFNESFSQGVVPGIWKEAAILPLKREANRQGANLLPNCQPRILCCQDNGENGAQPSIQPSRDKRMALQRTGWLPQASLLRGPNP